MIGRLVKTLIAAVALAVAAGCALVAACYALYALLREPLGPAGAAAVTAIAMSVVALLIGLLFLGRSKPARHAADDHHESPAAMLQQQALHLVRAKPVIAAGAGVVGLYILLRRPGLIALVASNLLGMRTQKAKDRRRGMFG